jgi:hypothetical protein
MAIEQESVRLLKVFAQRIKVGCGNLYGLVALLTRQMAVHRAT